MKKEWETPKIQSISFRTTEGGTIGPFSIEYSIYKTGS
jgi:hypothetical protein